MSKPIADIHCHTGLKPAFNNRVKNIWEYYENKPPKDFLPFFNIFRIIALNKQYKNLATETQSNLDSCLKGRVKIIGFSIYPVERQYASRKNGYLGFAALLTFFLFKKGMLKIFSRKRELFFSLLEIFVGISKNTSQRFWDEQKNRTDETVNYYEDYKKELQIFINENEKQEIQGAKRLKILQYYSHYNKFKNEENTICGFLTVEGLHSFGEYNLKDLFQRKNISTLSELNKTKLIRSLEKNLNETRKSNYCPFFVTLSHHFNNLIFGHAKSFAFPMNLFFRQKRGMNEGISKYGEILIQNLLDKKVGRRILLDTKHLSVRSRIQFYQVIKTCNKAFLNHQDDLKIPIICSHGAINGRKTLKESFMTKMKNSINRKSYVSRWDVNLCDEDILKICDSNGLIGILMHEGRMPGKMFDKRLKKILKSKKLNRNEKIKNQKLLYIQLFLTNVYHIIQVTYNQAKGFSKWKGWDIVSLGSDNDGIVNPFDTYKDSGSLTEFRTDIEVYLNNYQQNLNLGYGIIDILKSYKGKKQISDLELRKLNGDFSSKEIVDKIFYNNVDSFLKTYFTKEYLVEIRAS